MLSKDVPSCWECRIFEIMQQNLFSRLWSALLLLALAGKLSAQYLPPDHNASQQKAVDKWAKKTFRKLNSDERLGQLFIIALYTNKGEDFIQNVSKIVREEQIGGLILMQDDAAREISLVNQYQQAAKVPLLIGMDAEWGLFQRIPQAHKLPWALTLGAVQDKDLVRQMAALIAQDAKRMGINWVFAPVVDVNTNPANPIIGNRSFGSDIENVTSSARAYARGLQENGVLAAIKHFPGHGDTDTDSHLDLPVVSHPLSRLQNIELAPYRKLMQDHIGGVMVAHLYVPALEPKQGVPASVSKNIITGLLKEKMGYKGLVITDALNMNAVASRFSPGELDALAFQAGNDIMLFSQDVKTGKKIIAEKLQSGEIPRRRVKESVLKILKTKYLLGLTHWKPSKPENILQDINTPKHAQLSEKIYSNAATLLQKKNQILPLQSSEKYYYLALEEGPSDTFFEAVQLGANISRISAADLPTLPTGSTVIIGLHKDNSSAYKPYIISEASKKILSDVAKIHPTVVCVFGSPYALRDIDITPFSAVVVGYENNPDAHRAISKLLQGNGIFRGALPVEVNDKLKFGMGIRPTN